MASSNVNGQAYAFMAMTPIKPGEQEALQEYLHGLRDQADRSPLAKLERTHMGRWVIADRFVTEPSWKQRKPETLEDAWLIFTSNFDGDLDSYLDELATKLAEEAQHIWGRCIGCPDPPKGAALVKYLKHNQIDTGLFFAAYGNAKVPDVKRCLDQREQVVAFARRAQGLEAEALQAAFLEEFGS